MKVWNYAIISFVIAAILSLSGISVGTSEFLTKVGFLSSDFKTSFLYIAVEAVLVASLIGISIGSFVGIKSENFVIASTMGTSLFLFIDTFVGVIYYVNSNVIAGWIKYPIIIVMGAFTVGYLLSLSEFLRGTD